MTAQKRFLYRIQLRSASQRPWKTDDCERRIRHAAQHAICAGCQFQMVEMVVDDFCFDQVFCVTDGIMLKYMQTASDQEDAFSRAHSLLPTEQVRVALCMVAE